MGALEELLDRNARFAHGYDEELPPIPSLRTLIVACPDPRVDPAQVLGLELGEAVVIRTAGGRVTPAVLQNLALLAQVAATEGATGGFELLLMQHTDCGMARLQGPEHAEGLAAYFGVDVDELAAKSIADPYAGVRADIEGLAANRLVPGSLSVSGLVYDVETGTAELVERRSPLREAA